MLLFCFFFSVTLIALKIEFDKQETISCFFLKILLKQKWESRYRYTRMSLYIDGLS